MCISDIGLPLIGGCIQDVAAREMPKLRVGVFLKHRRCPNRVCATVAGQ